MSTESIMSASKTLFKHKGNSIDQTFTASADIKVGQAVKISGNGTVAPALKTERAIGVCVVGGLSGKRVTIAVTLYSVDALVQIKGGTGTAGALVAHSGVVNSTGVPEVATAVTGDYAKGIILSGGSADAEIRIGILNYTILIP